MASVRSYQLLYLRSMLTEPTRSTIADMVIISQMAMEPTIQAEIHRDNIHRECRMKIAFDLIR